MGVVSRKVFPLCGELCFFCPSLRARSRQPVKRYKKLLFDIFLRSQSYNPFVEPDCSTCQQTQFQGSSSSYSNNLQYQPQFLHLPASSPFDNFLKSAGC